MVALSDLLTPVTEEQATATILGILQALGLPSTSWQPFAVPRLFVRLVARLYSTATASVAAIAAGGFLDTAAKLPADPTTGRSPWLDLLAIGAYQNPPFPATTTAGVMLLEDVGGAGPTSISAGQIIVQTPDGKLRFTSTSGGTLPLNGVLRLTMQAESPGAAYNIASNYQGLKLATSLPGVRATNPPPIGASTWVTSSGTDPESATALADRCRTKWPTLATGGATPAYANWARTGAPSITRVYVDDTNPDGPGTVAVIVATSAGPADGPTVGAADAYIQARRALTGTVTTSSASAITVTVAATLYVSSSLVTAAVAAASAALTALVESVNMSGTVYYSQVLVALSQPGVRNIEGLTLNGAAADVVLSSNQVATLATAFVTLQV